MRGKKLRMYALDELTKRRLCPSSAVGNFQKPRRNRREIERASEEST
jgi:hypothetical protein